ncbi:MAG TPA: superoxide dismutase family protein [Candidatus Limnocylindria bacterium]|nr:superoxide dismutase family protein [Candidatus Limnocylindria bacterium]
MNKGIQGIITTTIITSALVLAGCKSMDHHGRHAMAELSPASGSNVRGTVHFYETPKGIRVVAKVSGLTPGLHGFHVHDKGDCSAPDASSAGGHFNPTSMKHGGPNDVERHAGDFGNITADASGEATFETVDSHISFDGPNSIIGRGVIVHANPDDLKSQTPTPGNAGKRVACGNIQLH